MDNRASKNQRSESESNCAESVRASKKQRSESESRKVGIVCHSMEDGKDGGYEVKIYVVDIDRVDMVKEYDAVEPAVRFCFPATKSMRAVCVLNLTVYMFGGYDPRLFVYPDSPKKTAHKCVLSSDLEKTAHKSVLSLNEQQLVEITNMNHAKAIPKAIPTPAGSKILVFATLIGFEDPSHDFELYNPVSGDWEQLPGLPYPCHEFFEVTSYSFSGESCFVVVTDKVGAFALDLDNRAWATINIPAVNMDGYFVMAKRRYALSNAGIAYDFGIEGQLKFVDFPLSPFVPPSAPDCFLQYTTPSIIPLHSLIQGEGEGEGEAVDTCVLQIEAGNNGRLLIDVCRTKLTTLDTKVSNSVTLGYFAFETARLTILDQYLKRKELEDATLLSANQSG